MSRSPFRILGIKTAFLGDKGASKNKASPVSTSPSSVPARNASLGSAHADERQYYAHTQHPAFPKSPPPSVPSYASAPDFYKANHASASSLAPTERSSYSGHAPSASTQNRDDLGSSSSGEKTLISTKSYIKMIQAKIDDLEKEHETMTEQLRRDKVLHDEKGGKLQSKERDLVDLIEKKKQDIKRLQGELHSHTKDIKVEDDDYSTINRKMIKLLDYNLTNLPLSLKKYVGNLGAATQFFLKRWPEMEPVITRVAKPVKGDATIQLNYSFICLLVEKLVAEVLVEQVFFVPIHLGHSELNTAFQHLANWMEEQHAPESWIIRLRQQLCKAAAGKKPQATDEAKRAIVNKLIDLLSNIFILENNSVVTEKLTNIVNSAANISMAMRQEKIPVQYRIFTQGDSLDTSIMTVANGSEENVSTIQFAVWPLFFARDSSEDEEVVVERAKVYCADFSK